jgi:hypothetical protein
MKSDLLRLEVSLARSKPAKFLAHPQELPESVREVSEGKKREAALLQEMKMSGLATNPKSRAKKAS